MQSSKVRFRAVEKLRADLALGRGESGLGGPAGGSCKGAEDPEDDPTVKAFVQDAENDVTSLLEEEKKIMALVKSTGDYFHGKAGKDEGLRVFVIVRDFLLMLDKVCKEVTDAQKKQAKAQKQEAPKA
ncbi:hypothetical protein K1719_020146 [Acacia pycnantha]|nr:hypothetical protein K1719_020146 [Acacia pycnantha]